MIDPRITKARSALIMDYPFFGSLAMRLQIIMTTAYDTMATDGRRLLVNLAFLDTITARQLIFVMAHEVMHCAMNHHTRRGNRDPKQWNIACDYVINLILKRAGFDLPDFVLLDEQYEGLGAEAVYRILENAKQKDVEQKKQEQDQQPPPEQEQQNGDGEKGDDGQVGDDAPDGDSDEAGDGETSPSDEDGSKDAEGGEAEGEGEQPADKGQGDGNGKGDGSAETEDTGPSDPGGCGEVIDAAPDHDEAAIADQEAEWEVAVRQAVNIAKKQNAGTVPGFLQEVVADLADPRTDWREVLRRFVDPSTTKDYSWINPNRRLMSQGFYNPGLVSDGVNHIAIVVDTSGSIDQDALQTFGGETQAALDEGAIDKLTVVFADTRVNRVAEYAKGDRVDFTVQGRGGTAFAPSFAWLNENAPDISAAIYFTDLECSDFGDEPAYPVLWAAYGDPRNVKHYSAQLPFGECVELQ